MTSSSKNPIVYVGMTADILHHGHINILKEARKYGEVTVGLLSDRAIATYKRIPHLTFEQRRLIFEQLRDVSAIIEQAEWDYSPTLRRLKPDFMIHGDDWNAGSQRKYRDLAYAAMNEWGGTIVEVPYTQGISSNAVDDQLRQLYSSPQLRLGLLHRLLQSKPMLRALQAHDAMSARIVEKAFWQDAEGHRVFDALWCSSLADSMLRCRPDTESIDLSVRIGAINSMFDACSKPLILDFNTGGTLEHMDHNIQSLERMGVSALVIEDKAGSKRNSLLGPQPGQQQENMNVFCTRLQQAVRARKDQRMLIWARIESLVLGNGMHDALERARAYIDAGVDGILIHSRQSDANEVLAFADAFDSFRQYAYLAAVPTTYSTTPESQLASAGFNLVIYANQLIRAAYPAMLECAHTILMHERAAEAEKVCLPIAEMLSMVTPHD